MGYTAAMKPALVPHASCAHGALTSHVVRDEERAIRPHVTWDHRPRLYASEESLNSMGVRNSSSGAREEVPLINRNRTRTSS